MWYASLCEKSADGRLKASIDATGVPLGQQAIDAAKSADAVLLGAIGGPVSAFSVRELFPPVSERSQTYNKSF